MIMLWMIYRFIDRCIDYLDYYYLQGLRRTKKMNELARNIEMDFVLNGNYLLSELRNFEIFTHDKVFFEGIKNLVRGKVDNTVISIFDYRYSFIIYRYGYSGDFHTSSETRHKIKKDHTIVYFLSELLDLPKFSLHRKGLGDKIANFFTKRDIQFESNLDFSKYYSLRGENEDSIKRVFNKELLSFEKSIVNKGIRIEGSGNKLIYYQKKPVKLKDMSSFINSGFQFFEVITMHQLHFDKITI